MEKKTLYIIIAVAVVAVIVIAAVGIAVGSQNNNDNNDKYVTYEGNGGKDSLGKTSYKENSETVGETKFFRENYIMTEYKDSAGTTYHKGDHVNYGTTLYAQWKPVTDMNVKITSNTLAVSNMTIKNGSSPAMTVGDNMVSDPNCSFKIRLTATDPGYYFTSDGSTVLGQFLLKDGSDHLICTITVSATEYSECNVHDFGAMNYVTYLDYTCLHMKEMAITLSYEDL